MALNIKIIGFFAILLQFLFRQNSSVVFAQYAKLSRAEAKEKCNTAYYGLTCKDITKMPGSRCKVYRKHILEGITITNKHISLKN